ncbi:MAG: hypothetical protein PHR20_07850 [Bacteroidales bacterium]|nr:hypothetical protein [Bacteroidales bacterium]
MKHLYIFIIALISLSFFTSCDYNNPDGVPSYIKIDTSYFSVTSPNSQGSASSNISDVWVYVNNSLQGIYELPATFPVLAGGATKLYFRAGIKLNGISGQRSYYSFYKPTEAEEYDLKRGEITEITPSYTYKSGLTFEWMEDYENLITRLVPSEYSDTTINIIYDDRVFEGHCCGEVVLQDSCTYFELLTNTPFDDLPVTSGDPIFLELNYKIDSLMAIGIYANYSTTSSIMHPIVILTATSTWKKVYISMQNAFGNYYAAESFDIYFAGGGMNIKTVERQEYLIDNIKLIY